RAVVALIALVLVFLLVLVVRAVGLVERPEDRGHVDSGRYRPLAAGASDGAAVDGRIVGEATRAGQHHASKEVLVRDRRSVRVGLAAVDDERRRSGSGAGDRKASGTGVDPGEQVGRPAVLNEEAIGDFAGNGSGADEAVR